MKKNINNRINRSNSAEAETVFRRFQHTLPFRLLVKGFRAATKYIPVCILRIIGIFFVFMFIIFNFGNYTAIRKNLTKICPGKSLLTYSFMAFSVFKNYSYYLIDLFHLSHDLSRFRKYDVGFSGLENLESALSEKKGIILLTTHLGNWEIGGVKLSSMGRRINVVYSPDSLSLLEHQRSFVRFAEGITEIPLSRGGFSSLKLLRILREGKTVALQGDRLMFDPGIVSSFFGHDALLPKGPVKLAIVSDSIILPVFIPITGFKSYEIIIEKPIYTEKFDDSYIELKTNLNKIIKILEKYIGIYPTQWYTFMPFWEEDKKVHTNENSSDLP
ncbi:MAG: lysophospholipid acyltransferase family protein [Nitrospirota bacterium]